MILQLSLNASFAMAPSIILGSIVLLVQASWIGYYYPRRDLERPRKFTMK